MNWKKALCCVLTALLLATMISASAQELLPQNILMELNAYGILQGDENGDFKLDEAITRGEFSKMLVHALKIDNLPVDAVSAFTDIKETDWFYGDVMRLVKCGVLHGYEDGTFRPLENISSEQAAKALVVALNYSQVAESSGGYPIGYLATATKLGILKNVAMKTPMARSEIGRMIYNSLDVQLMEVKSINTSGENIYNVGKTRLRDLHLFASNDGALVKQRGIVEATTEAWLIRPYNNLKANQVVIDGYTYDIGQTDAFSYFGMEVEFYASADSEDGPYTIQNIGPTRQNDVITLTEREYLGISSKNTILAEVDDETKKLEIETGTILIKNLRRIHSPLESDYSLTRGTVTLINNNGDDKFDIVVIEEYDSLMVERANENGIWFYLKSFRNQRVLPILDDVQYYITDEEGQWLAAEEIPPMSVVSITANLAETIYKIRVSTAMVSGTVTEISEDAITIDGETILVESETKLDVSVGDDIDCYINFRGEAYYVDAAQTIGDYAYVIATGSSKSFGPPEVRLAIPGRFSVDEKIDTDDEDAIAIKTLKAHNSEIKTMRLSQKVALSRWVNGADGKTVLNKSVVSAEKAVEYLNGLSRPIIRYITSGNGEVREIIEPELIGTNILDSSFQRKYNGNELIFGGTAVRGAFGVMDSTRALCVPDKIGGIDDVTREEDYLAGIEMLNEGSYKVNGYDTIVENGNARLIVVQFALRYDSQVAADENKVSILERMTTIINEEDEILSRLTFWSQGKRYSYGADPSVAEGLKEGDVFLYTLGANNDEIIEIERITSLSPKNSWKGCLLPVPGDGTRYITFESPVNVEYNQILEEEYRRVDTITFHDSKLNKIQINSNVRGGPSVYLYDEQRGNIRASAINEIVPGGQDKVFVYSSAQRIRMIVIVR